MTLPSKHLDNTGDSRVHTTHKRRHHARPFQFGLGSLLVFTPLAGLMAAGLAMDNFLGLLIRLTMINIGCSVVIFGVVFGFRSRR